MLVLQRDERRGRVQECVERGAGPGGVDAEHALGVLSHERAGDFGAQRAAAYASLASAKDDEGGAIGVMSGGDAVQGDLLMSGESGGAIGGEDEAVGFNATNISLMNRQKEPLCAKDVIHCKENFERGQFRGRMTVLSDEEMTSRQ